MTFLIFFSIILLIYGLANYYIYIRGHQALAAFPSVKIWYSVAFMVLAASFFAGRIAERIYLSVFTDILTWVGAFWLAAMLYFFLAVLLIDIIRLLIWVIPGISLDKLMAAYPLRLIVFIAVFTTTSLLLIVGYYQATHPKTTRLELKVKAKSADRKEITIAIASDIHLGTLIARKRVKKLINTINGNNPDIILLPGDIVDEDIRPVIRQDLGKDLEKLSAPLGIWAITGNHEYIGGADQAVAYLEEHGIKFLRDSAVKINHLFWLAGREDRDKRGFSGRERKSLEEIMRLTDNTLPVILMDHQPFHLDKVAAAGVDLQVSGHTHHGQLWPLNYITEAIYEVSHGYVKKGNTHFFVSSGFGGWGPPVRLGSGSEIVIIKLQLTD